MGQLAEVDLLRLRARRAALFDLCINCNHPRHSHVGRGGRFCLVEELCFCTPAQKCCQGERECACPGYVGLRRMEVVL